MILAIDPGRKPGYVLLDETQLIPRAHLPGKPALPLVIGVALSLTDMVAQARNRLPYVLQRVIIEGQHGKLDTKRKRSILTLSIEAGWQLHRAVLTCGGEPAIIHPQALSHADPPGWRDALRCAGVTKAVVQARVERSLLPHEASLFACASAARLGDCLDATAIGWGAYLANPKTWEPPP